MKYQYFFISILCASAVFTGCGKNRKGTYSGNETVNTPGASAVSTTANLNLTDDSNSKLNGNFSDSSGSASFSGTVSNDGNSLQNVTLNVPAQPSTSTVNGIPSTGCGGTYTGTLTLTDNGMSGTLTLTSPQAVQPPAGTTANQTGYTNGYTNGYQTGYATTGTNLCQGATRSVTLNKSN